MKQRLGKQNQRIVVFLLVLMCWTINQVILHKQPVQQQNNNNNNNNHLSAIDIVFNGHSHQPTIDRVKNIDDAVVVSTVRSIDRADNGTNTTKQFATNRSAIMTTTSILNRPQKQQRPEDEGEDGRSISSSIHHHPNFTFDFPVCLVHIGKAAGSTISCGLGLMYANCEGMPRTPAVPHTQYFHMRRNHCSNTNNNKDTTTRTFLITIRNPLTRIRSWFDFEKNILPARKNKEDEIELRKKRSMLFVECYPTFESLVQSGLMPLVPVVDSTTSTITASATTSSTTSTNTPVMVGASDPINMTCQERAWAAVLGVREFSYHEWYNYEHYWTALQNYPISKPSKATPTPDKMGGNTNSSLTVAAAVVVVVRTEHVIEDWSQLSKEPLFRQVNRGNVNGTTTLSKKEDGNVDHNHGSLVEWNLQNSSSDMFNDNNNNNTLFLVNLCRALCPEIQIYKQILLSAHNLNTTQIYDSMREIQVWCPLESSTTVRICPDIPSFPPMKVIRRRYATETKKRLFQIVSRKDVDKL
jgi:hypothetical protein